MTTYVVGPNPKWYFVDKTGKPLAGGYIATYNASNPTQQKLVYQDAAGLFPYPYVSIPNSNLQGIRIDEPGIQGPLYFDPDNATFISVYDINGVFQWNDPAYLPGGSGGGNITEALNLTNLITNNTFYRNTANSANPIGSQNVLLAPGAHSGFAMTTVPSSQADIRFIKSNLASSDTFSFIAFTPGSNALSGPPQDVTPPNYFNYTCTGVGGGGETSKFVQFPISTDIQSTSGQQMTFTIWARCNSGANQLSIYWDQFFGDGTGAASPNKDLIDTYTLTTNWSKFSTTFTMPSIAGKTIGACNNTALYILVQYPLSQVTNIDFIKPCLFMGSIAPALEYQTNDQIDAVINTPRTGDVRVSMNSFAPYGWVSCDDGTIGDPSSNATNRANFDTFPLYDLIWNSCDNTLAPLQNSSGTPIARGASSIADYQAHNRLSLTKVLGRALSSVGQPSSGGTGNSWPLGTAQGEEKHTLTTTEMPPHTHSLPGFTGQANDAVGSAGSTNVGTAVAPPTTGSTGGSGGVTVPHNTIQPTAYFNVMLKL